MKNVIVDFWKMVKFIKSYCIFSFNVNDMVKFFSEILDFVCKMMFFLIFWFNNSCIVVR